MSSWKRTVPVGNTQSSFIKKYKPRNEINLRKNIIKSNQKYFYKIATNIDNSVYQQNEVLNINSLIDKYSSYINSINISNKMEIIRKFQQVRYKKLYDDRLDIHFIDLFNRLLKFFKLYNKVSKEGFCALFITTAYNNLIETFTPFYLMNFNKKYYDNI